MYRFRNWQNIDIYSLIKEIKRVFGDEFTYRDLGMVFAAGMMGNPRPTFKIEKKMWSIISRHIQSQISTIKNDDNALENQNKKIKRVRKTKSLRKLTNIDHKDFEYWTAGFFQDLGCKSVIVVPPGPDFGVDISMTTPNRRRAIVQCKRYKQNHLISRPIVQQTYGVMHAMKAHYCYVVTTSNFTRDAITFSEEVDKGKKVILINGKDLTKKTRK